MANLNLLRTASGDTKIYGVYENIEQTANGGGIYYFEVDKTSVLTDDQYANILNGATRIIERAKYGEKNLLELTLDVSGDTISISFMPNDGQTPLRGYSRVFSGRIVSGSCNECVNMPSVLPGVVQQLITEFTTANTNPPNRPIKIMRVNSGTSDKIHLEGH